jgi:TRAP-type C4-dicarboxylate transport system permease small subunit
VEESGLPLERRADAVLGVAASAILFSMMLLTFVDVVARYLFNFPLRGGFEVTELMLLVLIFAGLPLVSHADEHVTMDFPHRPGARLQDVRARQRPRFAGHDLKSRAA